MPVFSLAEFKYESLQSVNSLAALQIINGLLLILLWAYLIRHRSRLMTQEEELNMITKSYMYSRLVLIPSLYTITTAIAFFFGVKAAAIFPVIVIPSMLLLGRIFGPKERIPPAM